jgi:hypothetical protein
MAARMSGKKGGETPFTAEEALWLILWDVQVPTRHERRVQKKDTKLIKEVHVHLNLRPPHPPIASEAEESLEIESFEERVAQFEVENPVQ